MEQDLASLIAKRFIQRRDVKAIQRPNGDYMPHTVSFDDQTRLPWKMRDVHAHISGGRTYGHYLLDQDSMCRLFAFDIDLEKEGWWVEEPTENIATMTEEEYQAARKTHEMSPREAWLDRSHPGRTWMKFQFRYLAHRLAYTAHTELGLPVAMAYSGNKGVHVYCFTGPVPADQAFEGAKLVLDTLDEFEPLRGKAFFKHKNQDPVDGFPNLSVEVFPKQGSLEGKDLGNLMRLPLGKNLKNPKDPTFFIDSSAPMNILAPHPDPERLLSSGNPWI